jgi:hypothetical protein
MKPIYNIYVFDTVNGYCVENLHFSSKKTALDSMAYIREHLIKKFDIDIGRIENYGTTSDEQFIVWLDERFKMTYTKNHIYTSVIKYI